VTPSFELNPSLSDFKLCPFLEFQSSSVSEHKLSSDSELSTCFQSTLASSLKLAGLSLLLELCIFSCLLRLPLVAKDLSHFAQQYGFSPVCVDSCMFSSFLIPFKNGELAYFGLVTPSFELNNPYGSDFRLSSFLEFKLSSDSEYKLSSDSELSTCFQSTLSFAPKLPGLSLLFELCIFSCLLRSPLVAKDLSHLAQL